MNLGYSVHILMIKMIKLFLGRNCSCNSHMIIENINAMEWEKTGQIWGTTYTINVKTFHLPHTQSS